jgi:hypothetical protein
MRRTEHLRDDAHSALAERVLNEILRRDRPAVQAVRIRTYAVHAPPRAVRSDSRSGAVVLRPLPRVFHEMLTGTRRCRDRTSHRPAFLQPARDSCRTQFRAARRSSSAVVHPRFWPARNRTRAGAPRRACQGRARNTHARDAATRASGLEASSVDGPGVDDAQATSRDRHREPHRPYPCVPHDLLPNSSARCFLRRPRKRTRQTH